MKTGMDAEKAASKRVVQNTAEATGDFIGNKIGDKTTSLGKTESDIKEIGKKKEKKNKKSTYHQKKKHSKLWMI